MNVVSADITNGLSDILDLFVQIFKYSFEFMRGISFFGTNLLNFTITMFLLLVLMPILFTLVRSESVNNQRVRERVNKLRSKRGRE